MKTLIAGTILSMITMSSLCWAAEVSQFALAYARAKSEAEKRSVCIKAIDANVIRGGTSIDTAKKIFGKDLEEFGVDSRSNRLAIVHFVRPWRSTNELMSDVFRGWYLSLTYASDGRILSYYLSNVNKESTMAPISSKQKARDEDPGLPIPK